MRLNAAQQAEEAIQRDNDHAKAVLAAETMRLDIFNIAQVICKPYTLSSFNSSNILMLAASDLELARTTSHRPDSALCRQYRVKHEKRLRLVYHLFW